MCLFVWCAVGHADGWRPTRLLPVETKAWMAGLRCRNQYSRGWPGQARPLSWDKGCVPTALSRCVRSLAMTVETLPTGQRSGCWVQTLTVAAGGVLVSTART